MRVGYRLLVTLVLIGMMAIPMRASAIGGPISTTASVTAGQITWYYKQRQVTNPQNAGPEVVFTQRSGVPNAFLGTHNCSQGGGGPIYQQYLNSLQPVRFYPINQYTFPLTFCIFSFTNGPNGSITGDLEWD